MSIQRKRSIIHLDLDAFFASVEQRDNPLYRDKPLVVGGIRKENGELSRRGVVCAASYQARKYGVHSGMPIWEAKQKCPHAIFTPTRIKYYQLASHDFFNIRSEYTPFVEPLSIDEAFLDVTSCQSLFGPAENIARKIKNRVMNELQLPVSVGIASNKFLAKIAKREGALTIGVVTRPFSFEGKKRIMQAEQGIEALKKQVDALITISNDQLLSMISKDTSVKEAFEITDRVLRQSVQAIADLITIPGLINLDLADVRAVIKDAGLALVGIGVGRGNNKGTTAAEAAISSPLLEVSIKGSNSILVNVTGGLDMSLYEINQIVDLVSKSAGNEANVVFGAIISEKMQDEIRVTVIATKCEKNENDSQNSIDTETIQDRIEKEESKAGERDFLGNRYQGNLGTEKSNRKDSLLEEEKVSEEETPFKFEDQDISKKYKNEEDLDIPTFIRNRNKRY